MIDLKASKIVALVSAMVDPTDVVEVRDDEIVVDLSTVVLAVLKVLQAANMIDLERL